MKVFLLLLVSLLTTNVFANNHATIYFRDESDKRTKEFLISEIGKLMQEAEVEFGEITEQGTKLIVTLPEVNKKLVTRKNPKTKIDR